MSLSTQAIFGCRSTYVDSFQLNENEVDFRKNSFGTAEESLGWHVTSLLDFELRCLGAVLTLLWASTSQAEDGAGAARGIHVSFVVEEGEDELRLSINTLLLLA